MNVYFYKKLDEKWANAAIYASNKKNFQIHSSTHLQTLKEETSLYICFDERSVPEYLHIVNPDDFSMVYTVYDPQLRARVLSAPRVFNLRDFGGYPAKNGKRVKKGIFFRSGKLNLLKKPSIEIFQALGINTIIDLRSSLEVTSMPTPDIAGIQNINIQIGADMDGKLKLPFHNPDNYVKEKDDQLGKSYRLFAQSTESYRRIFDLLLDRKTPVLLHCTAGKDRTGVTAALILLALGVDLDIVFMDYLLTNNFNQEIAEDILSVASIGKFHLGLDQEQLAGILASFIHAKPAYLENALNEMCSQYGSVTGFLKNGVGLSKEELHTLQDLYLE